MAVTTTEIIRRAEAIAAETGGNWVKCLDQAYDEAHQPTLQKIVRKPSASDERLSKAAVVAHLQHTAGIGNPDPDRKIEIGECETELGRVRVMHAWADDAISIHGVHTPLSDIDKDLRDAFTAASAAFSAAETDAEQTGQRAVIGVLVDAILRRHEFLSAKVKGNLAPERYDI